MTLAEIIPALRMLQGQQRPPATSGPPSQDTLVGGYSDAPDTGYEFPVQPPARSAGNGGLAGMMRTMAGSPEGLGWLSDAATNTSFMRQREAAGIGTPGIQTDVDWRKQLTAAAIGAVMNALERGSGKGFADGFMLAEQRRIDEDHRKTTEKANQQREIKMIEARQALEQARGYGQRRSEMMGARGQASANEHDLAMQRLRNQGALDAAGARSEATTESNVLKGIFGSPDNVQRLAALELARNSGQIDEASYGVLKGIIGRSTSTENLTDQRAQTEGATRANRVKLLAAQGQATQFRGELNKAMTDLTNKKIASFDRETNARITKLYADANKALSTANTAANTALRGGSARTVTPTSFFTAMNSISGAIAKVGALKAQLDANDAILNAKLRDLGKPNAKPSDPAKTVDMEVAEIQKTLEANTALRAGYVEMERRQNERMQMLSKLRVEADAAVSGGNQPSVLPGVMPPFDPTGAQIAPTGQPAQKSFMEWALEEADRQAKKQPKQPPKKDAPTKAKGQKTFMEWAVGQADRYSKVKLKPGEKKTLEGVTVTRKK